MNDVEQIDFDALYQKHLTALRLQGKAAKTIDGYGRAVRRLARNLDCCPDALIVDQLTTYFADLSRSHSWSTVKIDRNGIAFFHHHVLKRDMPWIEIVKPPVVHSLPDILTCEEIARIIAATRELRYRTFWFVTYSMGLRLSETLNLRIGDIDNVLPAGYRRVREYGFLHANARRLRALLQIVLQLRPSPAAPRPAPKSNCPHCGSALRVIATVFLVWRTPPDPQGTPA